MKSNDKKNLPRQGFSRRGFLKGAAIGAAAVTGTDLLKGNAEATEDGFYPARRFRFGEILLIFSPEKIKKRVAFVTLSIIRVHLLVLLLRLGVRGVTPIL